MLPPRFHQMPRQQLRPGLNRAMGTPPMTMPVLPAQAAPQAQAMLAAHQPMHSYMPPNGTQKGNWGDVGAMRGAESEQAGGFTAGGKGGKTGKYSRMQTPNTGQTGYVSVRQTHNPDRANVSVSGPS